MVDGVALIPLQGRLQLNDLIEPLAYLYKQRFVE